MTLRTRNTQLRRSDVLDISPDDAVATNLCDGERVRVVSRYGVAVLTVRVSPEMARGELFATFQTKELVVNALTGAKRDTVTDMPEYKVTAGRLERVPARTS